ncbi:MAG: hypothetical protein K8L97_20655 [Anaerolineae bacterium]|nr:hypothetical protein [Anaerolineae bacterium]
MSHEDEPPITSHTDEAVPTGSSSRELSQNISVDDRFREVMIRLRQGRYISAESLDAVDFSEEFKDTPDLIKLAQPIQRYCVADINLHGNDALSHLCLRFNLQYLLQKAKNIHEIRVLKKMIKKDTFRIELRHRPERYPKGNRLEREVIQTLAEWEQLPE